MYVLTPEMDKAISMSEMVFLDSRLLPAMGGTPDRFKEDKGADK